MIEAVPIMIQGGFAASVLAFMWKIAADQNHKSATIFRRFDEFKEHFDSRVHKEFVSKELFEVLNSHSRTDIERLEHKVDAGFKQLDCKITELIRNHHG